MTKILLLSDTHSFLDNRILHYAKMADEIWHAGDVGSIAVLESLENVGKLRAVFGNIDGHEIRQIIPEILEFECEQVKVFITHIGGYPKKYVKGIKEMLKISKPKIFISGHSHILKVMFDNELHILHINPGAAGISGFHKVRTMIRFEIDTNQIKNMEVIELNTKN